MEIKLCSDCVHFRTLFIRGNYELYVYRLGACTKQDKTVERNDSCQCWQKREKSNYVSSMVLKRAIFNLDEIKQLLLEEKERREKG